MRTPVLVAALVGCGRVGSTRVVTQQLDGPPGNAVCGVRDRPSVAMGDLYCWGENKDGQLGLGDTMPRAVPTKVTL